MPNADAEIRHAPDHSSRPELALFLRTLHGGGAERVFLRLAGELSDVGYGVTVVAVTTAEQDHSWVPSGVSVVDLQARTLGRSIIPLSRFLRSQRPGVLLSAVSAANVIALVASRLAGSVTPVVVTEHNTQSVQRADAQTFMRATGTPWLMRRTYPSAAAIIGVSRGVSVDLEQFAHLPSGSVTAIPNPVIDASLMEDAAAPLPSAWRSQVGDAPLIVSAGRVVPHKGHDMLLRAFARVVEARPEVRLAILGDGESLPDIVGQIEQLGLSDRVIITGFEPNPYAWLSRAHVLALSSRYEGLPTILIEALACGARVVSTDCPSGPAEILEDGRFGRLVGVGDDQAFAQALIDALDEGRWPMPPEEALARYRPDAVIDAYRSIIDPLLTEATDQ